MSSEKKCEYTKENRPRVRFATLREKKTESDQAKAQQRNDRER